MPGSQSALLPVCLLRLLEKLFPIRPEIKLQTPGGTILLNHVPIGFGNGRRIHKQLAGLIFVAQLDLTLSDHTIDNNMRNMDAFRPQLSSHTLSETAHSKFCAAESDRRSTNR